MNYYRTVSFLSPSATLTNFPVLVRINNDTAMATRIASSSGYDVAFETLGGTPLDFELDFYDPITRSGAWWVKIPTLAADSPTAIRMTYGDASVTTDQSAVASDVWTEEVYYEVLHYRTGQPKCVFGRFVVSSVTGASQTATSTIGRELTFTGTGACKGQFSAYPSFTYNGYNSAMGVMSIAQISTSSDAWLMCRPMYNPVSSTTQEFGTAWGSPYYSRPQDANWLAYGMTQYYKGGGYSQVNFVVNGVSVFNGQDGTNLDNEIHGVLQVPTGGYTSTISVAETRYYSTYVPTAWMAYEQTQVLNHDAVTTYGDEYNSDGTLVPQFVFRPWLKNSGISLSL